MKSWQRAQLAQLMTHSARSRAPSLTSLALSDHYTLNPQPERPTQDDKDEHLDAQLVETAGGTTMVKLTPPPPSP
jgi:hypothetical protein